MTLFLDSIISCTGIVGDQDDFCRIETVEDRCITPLLQTVVIDGRKRSSIFSRCSRTQNSRPGVDRSSSFRRHSLAISVIVVVTISFFSFVEAFGGSSQRRHRQLFPATTTTPSSTQPTTIHSRILSSIVVGSSTLDGNSFFSRRRHNVQEAPHFIGRGTRQSRLFAVAKSGGTMIQTESQYEETVLSVDTQRPVLVFFSAPWCGPCRLTVPVVKDILKQFSGQIDVVEVCTDDLAQVAEEAGVVSIPTIQFYYKGKALESHSIVGCVAKTVLANAVEKVLEDAEQMR